MQEALNKIIEDYIENEGNIISVLQQIQEEFNYLPKDAIHYVSDRLSIPSSYFYGVATFYSQFYLKPRGKHIITTCCGTACHVKGSDKLYNQVREEFNLTGDEDTSGDGLCTAEKVACVGACSIAPVVIVDKKILGKVQKKELTKVIKEIKEEQDA